MQVERCRVSNDGNRFEIRLVGDRPHARPLFICEREYITKDGKVSRGNWLMKMHTTLGWLIVDRDQYSNDLVELAGIHVETGDRYGKTFKIECSREHYLMNVHHWVTELEFQFGGLFKAEYSPWEYMAVLTKNDAVHA